jgi:hypothetical protein
MYRSPTLLRCSWGSPSRRRLSDSAPATIEQRCHLRTYRLGRSYCQPADPSAAMRCKLGGEVETHFAPQRNSRDFLCVSTVARKVGCHEPHCRRSLGEGVRQPALPIAPEGRRSIEALSWPPFFLAPVRQQQ